MNVCLCYALVFFVEVLMMQKSVLWIVGNGVDNPLFDVAEPNSSKYHAVCAVMVRLIN